MQRVKGCQPNTQAVLTWWRSTATEFGFFKAILFQVLSSLGRWVAFLSEFSTCGDTIESALVTDGSGKHRRQFSPHLRSFNCS